MGCLFVCFFSASCVVCLFSVNRSPPPSLPTPLVSDEGKVVDGTLQHDYTCVNLKPLELISNK